METSGMLEDLICSIAHSDDHFLEEPILLTNCGHFVCRKCIPNGGKVKVTCQFGEVTDRDFNNDKESTAMMNMLNVCLKNTFEAVASKATDVIRKLKGTRFNKTTNLSKFI